MMKIPELLVPANNLEVLKVAVLYGADAVYIGGEAFGLRAGAKNATLDELREGVEFAHARRVKVYVTANILAHNADLEGIRGYFHDLKSVGPDALIISDPGVFTIARQVCPEIDVHISTQANNTNYETFLFWRQLGAKRVVAARELSLQELETVRRQVPEDLEIEVFCHGAMCVSYSGRCLLSNFLAGRDANHGECTHPCRWKYALVEETRPGEYFPVEENERGSFILNSKDLCMIDRLPDLLRAGVDSLKIEGRMKTALYVAAVTRAYRLALDTLAESEETYDAHREWYRSEVGKCTHRPYSTGFFYGKPTENDQIYGTATYETGAVYVGMSEGFDDDGLTKLTQKNKFAVGDRLTILSHDGRNIETEVLEILDDDGNAMESAPHARQSLHVRFSVAPDLYDIIRKEVTT